jgi:hypothetical protein
VRLAADAIAPVATVILVVITLFGALPIYVQVAARSYAAQIARDARDRAGGLRKGQVLVAATSARKPARAATQPLTGETEYLVGLCYTTQPRTESDCCA